MGRTFLLILFLAVMFLSPCSADDNASEVSERDLFEMALSTQTASNPITERVAVLNYHRARHDLLWPYAGEADAAWEWDVGAELHDGTNIDAAYRGAKGFGRLARKFSPHWQVAGALGAHLLADRTTDSGYATPFVEVSTTPAPTDEFRGALRLNNDYIYPDFIQPGAITERISATSGYLDLYMQPHPKIRILLRPSLRRFSDDNFRKYLDGSIFYGISEGWPWIWVGVGSEYLSYIDYHPTYWSPQRFLAFGPRIDAAFPIVAKLSAAVALNINHFQEGNYPWGNGYYGSVKLQYGTRDEGEIHITYTGIRSTQNDSTWISDQFAVGFTTPCLN